MTEFTKLKITFAMALLGTLFALHPLLDRFADWGFLYLGYDLKVFYVYSLTSGLLSLCVYLYAVTLLNDHPHSWCERTGNSTYALAILVVPIYAGLYLSAKLADQVAVSHVAWAAPRRRDRSRRGMGRPLSARRLANPPATRRTGPDLQVDATG